MATINLSHHKLDAATLKKLSEEFISQPGYQSISTLQLGFNNLSDDGAKVVSNFLFMDHGLLSLDLSFNSIGVLGAEFLAWGLRRNRNLKTLFLSGNALGPIGFRLIGDAITNHPNLASLNLSGNSGLAEGAMGLAESLASNGRLAELILNGNRITAEGVRHIGSVMKASCNIQVLMLADNMIGDDGLRELSTALTTYRRISRLQLSFNEITSSGMEAFSASLAGYISLRTLQLDNNKLGDGGINFLANVIPSMALKSLDVGFNAIGSDGISCLCRILTPNKSIESLVLSGCNINAETANRISEMVRFDQVMRELYLDRVSMGSASENSIAAGIASNRNCHLELLTGFCLGSALNALGSPSAIATMPNEKALEYLRASWASQQKRGGGTMENPSILNDSSFIVSGSKLTTPKTHGMTVTFKEAQLTNIGASAFSPLMTTKAKIYLPEQLEVTISTTTSGDSASGNSTGSYGTSSNIISGSNITDISRAGGGSISAIGSIGENRNISKSSELAEGASVGAENSHPTPLNRTLSPAVVDPSTIKYTDISTLTSSAADDDDLIQPLLMSTEKLSIEVKSPHSLGLTEAERAAAIAEIQGTPSSQASAATLGTNGSADIPLAISATVNSGKAANSRIGDGASSPGNTSSEIRIGIESSLRPPSLVMPKDMELMGVHSPVVVATTRLPSAILTIIERARRLASLPFSAAELWQLDQYYFSPPVRTSSDDVSGIAEDFDGLSEGVSVSEAGDGDDDAPLATSWTSVGSVVLPASWASSAHHTAAISSSLGSSSALPSAMKRKAGSTTTTPRDHINPEGISQSFGPASTLSPGSPAKRKSVALSNLAVGWENRASSLPREIEIPLSSSAPKRTSATILCSSPLKRASNSHTMARIARYPRIQARLLTMKLEVDATRTLVLLRQLRFIEEKLKDIHDVDVEDLLLNHV